MIVSNQIEKLALLLTKLNSRKEKTEAILAEREKRLANAEKELAEFLETQGFDVGSKIKLSNGRTLIIKDFFSASIPTENSIISEKNEEKAHDLSIRRTQCLDWLNENNLGDIVKNEIVIAFDKGEHEKADELMEKLAEDGFTPNKEQTVHPMTLKSALKKAIENGKDVPFNTFSVQTGTKIDIK